MDSFFFISLIFLALFLVSFAILLLVFSFIAIKTKRPFFSVFESYFFVLLLLLLWGILLIPSAVVLGCNKKVITSYSMIDDSCCLCSSTVYIFGIEFETEMSIGSYVSIEGSYYFIDDDSSLFLIEFE